MKVLFVSTWFPYPPDNGSKLRAYYLVRELSRRHKVTVVAFHPPVQSAERPGARARDHEVEVWEVREDPFRLVTLPAIAKYASPIPLSAWPSAAMRRTLRMAASGREWDAIIAFQTPVARHALDLPGATRNTALIFDIDNSLTFVTSERVAFGSPASRLKARVSWHKSYRYESRLARRFDACTVVSPVEVGFIRQMVKGTNCRVEVNGNGVDCAQNRPGLAEAEPGSLVYNGSLTYRANYDAMRWFLAEVYPLVKRQLRDVSLTITGSTRGVDLAGLAIDESVRLTGYVDDVRFPVSQAAACVVPIRLGGGTRLKILEAMALGTPVLSTAKGAEGLEVVDGEHLLLADRAPEFASRTVELLRNADLRKRLAANARLLVEQRYDWQTVAGQFAGLVEQVVQERRSASR